jgi:hypothetical protein
MFVLTATATAPQLDFPERSLPPRLRSYELEDDLGVVRGRHIYEYDLVWDEPPASVEEVVVDALAAALAKGAEIAWFGFEGSFDFEYFLDPAVSSQIYAVATKEDVRLALDDAIRSSEEWRQSLVECRNSVLP